MVEEQENIPQHIYNLMLQVENAHHTIQNLVKKTLFSKCFLSFLRFHKKSQRHA